MGEGVGHFSIFYKPWRPESHLFFFVVVCSVSLENPSETHNQTPRSKQTDAQHEPEREEDVCTVRKKKPSEPWRFGTKIKWEEKIQRKLRKKESMLATGFEKYKIIT